MRALIRAKLQPKKAFFDLWEKPADTDPNQDRRADWNKAVVKVFLDLGYTAEVTGQQQLEANEFVQDVLTDIPDDIKKQEIKHLVMLGYIGEGQSHFVVSAVNPDEIHIRIKGRLLGRLRRSCVDMYRKIIALEKNRTPRLIKELFPWRKQSPEPYLVMNRIIEVMEPNRDHATIIGETIKSARNEVMRQNKNEVFLAVFTFTSAILLFLTTPFLAPLIQPYFAWLGPGFSQAYIQGVFERTYSAFLVTFAYTIINLLIKMLDIQRTKPIRWDPDIERQPNVR